MVGSATPPAEGAFHPLRGELPPPPERRVAAPSGQRLSWVAVSRRLRIRLIALAVLVGLVALRAAGGAGAAVTCPASAAAASGAVQWEFGVIGAPTAGASGVTSSWTRGKGTWSAGAASGPICESDSGSGIPKRDIVLRASGSSTLSPQIKRYGLLGVGLALGVRVSASDDRACPVGTSGTVTLFASYYSTHRDSIALRFRGGCADHDHTFTGSIVRVLIARDGAQVNSA